MTSVKVELEAVYIAPTNHNQSRHIYGVGEKVRFEVLPSLSDVTLSVIKADDSDNQTDYDTFSGALNVNGASVQTYVCPASGTTPDITISYCGVEYQPGMSIVEPQLIVTPTATGSGVFWPGQVGMGCLTTINYIGPMSVSFQGVQVFEIPCTHAIPPSGYFATNYTGRLTHDESAGAGWLHTIGSDNYWTHDEAGRDEPYEDWSAGTLEWKIPIGWRRLRYEGDSTLKAFEAERVKLRDEESRAMIIGGSEDSYKQKYTIESSGVSSVEKFGYRLSRSRWSISGEVTRIEE